MQAPLVSQQYARLVAELVARYTAISCNACILVARRVLNYAPDV